MEETEFDGEVLSMLVDMMPGGASKMEALQEYIKEADKAGDDHYSLLFRYQYACEATFRDDPPKAIPVAAEFGPIFERNPHALPDDGGTEAYLMITQMGIDPIVFLPQIPMKQWEDMMEKFYALVKRFNIGLRTYWWQMAQFWQYVDKEKAFEYFKKFWKTGRDGLSDCRACERSYAVMMSLMIGDREAADEYVKPLKAGRTAFCEDAPRLYMCAYLEDALDRGDLKAAVPYANQLSAKMKQNKNGLSHIGAVMRCFAYTNPDKAINKLEQGLKWAIKMWDQKKVYDFYKGSWVVMHEFAKKQETVKLNLSEDFKLYNEEGIYNCEQLEQWFYNNAKTIGQSFDKRNGSDYFEKNLALGIVKG